MIRSIQAIDWASLQPFPLAIHPGVTVLTGQNGSGKSSALDAIKAVLGAQRFGQGRTAAAYINSGRGVRPAAKEAFVLACCAGDGRPLPFADGRGEFTLVLRATRSRRLHLALPGHVMLGVSGASLAEDLQTFVSAHPRRQWMDPRAYQDKVLAPLGASAAARRLLEIPQGEAQRLLDGRPGRLLRDLLGLMGALEPLEALDARRGEYQEARAERDRAHRALLEEQLALERMSQPGSAHARLAEARDRLAEAEALARGSAHAAAEAAGDAGQAAKAACERAAGRLAEAQAKLEAARDARDAAAPAARLDRMAAAAAQALRDAGLDAEAPGLDAEAPWHAAAAGLAGAVAVAPGSWKQAQDAAAAHPGVTFIRAPRGPGPGRRLLDALLPAGVKLNRAGTHALSPAAGTLRPVAPAGAGDAGDTAAEAQAAADGARQDAAAARAQMAAAQAAAEAARDALEELGDGESLPAQAEELAGLLAARRRAQAQAAAAQAAAARAKGHEARLQRQARRLADAEELLAGQDGALEQAAEALAGAREFYAGQLRGLISGLDARFRDLCQAAGMRGELELVDDQLAEAGGRLNVRVAETPGGPLRSYHEEADLSGGWRAKTSVLILLAALAAAGGGRSLPVACLDEHSAQLDEDRAAEIGWVFHKLSREAGLQVICAMPSKRATERSEWTDSQVAFLKAGPQDAYAPLPHILEARA